ncbi:terminase small subunit [Rhodococcus spongiicola]|uniref:Terminase small subunit actinomycetes phage-type domain-containing protein n=1 Tax=Rhodococcus spongiicola TaxID=2487352 RepID=A0A3S3B9H1_9NOCA|nr:hypothetical protein [Rhodococcus spongiicola]RVW06234.1 hypothetical protein EF834_01910 [Rhodococcus spongiicola]
MAKKTLLSEVNASVRAAEHLQDAPQYRAAIEQARMLARVIDEAVDTGTEAATKASFGPVPTLHKVLTGLGLTPEGAAKLNLQAEAEGDELDAILDDRRTLRSV